MDGHGASIAPGPLAFTGVHVALRARRGCDTLRPIEMKRFCCYYGTTRKPCTLTLVAIESAIVAHAVEHLREAHPRFAASCPDLEARVAREVEDEIVYDRPVGSGGARFTCQDLGAPNHWRCKFVLLGETFPACVRGAVAHFAVAHPHMVPDEAALRAAVRPAEAHAKSSWEFTETPLCVRWAKPS